VILQPFVCHVTIQLPVKYMQSLAVATSSGGRVRHLIVIYLYLLDETEMQMILIF
jgi:hypothetical protein